MAHLFVFVLSILAATLECSYAEDSLDRTGTFNLTEENDSFFNASDRHYTQGIRLSYATGERASPGLSDLANAIFLWTESSQRSRTSGFLGQSIFTPENLSLAQPDPTDRPYAGWLYAGGDLYRETTRSLDRAEIAIGIVGPAAGAARTQNKWHQITRAFLERPNVNGWNAQLSNEPGIVITEERKWRLPTKIGALEADLLPEVNAAIGNVFTYGAVGMMVRLGQRIAVDWGPPRVQPGISGSDFVNRERFGPSRFAWYVFAGVEERLVLRNIFLDGNSFRDSASVDKEPLVSDFAAGFAAMFPYGRAAVTYTWRSKEFKTQIGDDHFLSITASFVF